MAIEQGVETQQGSRRAGAVVLYVVLALVFSVIIYGIMAFRFKGTLVGDILLERGYFQPVNTFFLFLGLVMVVAAYLQCRREDAAEKDANKVGQAVIRKWQERDRGLSDASYVSTQVMRGLQGQGDDILGAMIEQGLAEGTPASLSLIRRHRCMFMQRIRRIGQYLRNTKAQNLVEMMDMNRDLSSLDDDRLSGRYSFVRYIVYLMPVIGFMGTVWGIGRAMGGVSEALPHIKDLDGFIGSLGTATAALRVAFDTTLLALIYSGFLTLVLTLGSSRTDDFLGKLDTWIIDNILSHVTESNPMERTMRQGFQMIAGQVDGVLYDEGLAGIRASLRDNLGPLAGTMNELRDLSRNQETIADGIAENVNRLSETAGQRNEELLEGVKEVAECIGRVAYVSEEIKEAQAAGGEDVRRLASAVSELPNLVKTLGEAAGKLSELAGRLEKTGEMAEQVREGVTSLATIETNTAAITQMRDALDKMQEALAQQMDKANKATRDQIGEALKSVAQSNTVLRGALTGLTDAFLALSADIRKALRVSES